MKTFSLLALAAALLAASPAAASQAVGRDDSAEAVLRAAPASPLADSVLDGRMWRCDAMTCHGTSAGAAASQPALQECRRVVRKLGPVASYRTGDRVFDAAALAACNAR